MFEEQRRSTEAALADTREEIRRIQRKRPLNQPSEAPFVFAKVSCKRQADFIRKIDETLDEADAAVDEGQTSVAKELLAKGKRLLQEKLEHIKIADKYGWDTLDAYVDEEVVEGDEKRRRLARARTEANRQQQRRTGRTGNRNPTFRERNQMPFRDLPTSSTDAGHRFFRQPASQPSGSSRSQACWKCGKFGHWADECRSSRTGPTTRNAAHIASSTLR